MPLLAAQNCSERMQLRNTDHVCPCGSVSMIFWAGVAIFRRRILTFLDDMASVAASRLPGFLPIRVELALRVADMPALLHELGLEALSDVVVLICQRRLSDVDVLLHFVAKPVAFAILPDGARLALDKHIPELGMLGRALGANTRQLLLRPLLVIPEPAHLGPKSGVQVLRALQQSGLPCSCSSDSMSAHRG